MIGDRPHQPYKRAQMRRQERGHVSHADRRAIAKDYGIRNTGRQWVKLRKKLQRAARAAQRDRTSPLSPTGKY